MVVVLFALFFKPTQKLAPQVIQLVPLEKPKIRPIRPKVKPPEPPKEEIKKPPPKKDPIAPKKVVKKEPPKKDPKPLPPDTVPTEEVDDTPPPPPPEPQLIMAEISDPRLSFWIRISLESP